MEKVNTLLMSNTLDSPILRFEVRYNGRLQELLITEPGMVDKDFDCVAWNTPLARKLVIAKQGEIVTTKGPAGKPVVIEIITIDWWQNSVL